MVNEYEWLDAYDSPQTEDTNNSDVTGWVVVAVLLIALILVF